MKPTLLHPQAQHNPDIAQINQKLDRLEAKVELLFAVVSELYYNSIPDQEETSFDGEYH
ncbi:MAG: hypothetical protein QNJ62_06755 [Methyloceanibacter sp.]|nr:hypothetical protein [Methyloceanibacter sp.]